MMGKLLCVLLACGVLAWPWASVLHQLGPDTLPPYQDGELVSMPGPRGQRTYRVENLRWKIREVTAGQEDGRPCRGEWRYDLSPVE